MSDDHLKRVVLGAITRGEDKNEHIQSAMHLSRLLKLEPTKAIEAVDELSNQGMIRKHVWDGGSHYLSTQAGRDALAQPTGGNSFSNVSNSNISIQQGSGNVANQSIVWVEQLEAFIDSIVDATTEQKAEAKSALRKLAEGGASLTRDVAVGAMGAILAAMATGQL